MSMFSPLPCSFPIFKVQLDSHLCPFPTFQVVFATHQINRIRPKADRMNGMEFPGALAGPAMMMPNTMLGDDELLPMPTEYPNLAYALTIPSFAHPGFLDHQLLGPTDGSDVYLQESIGLGNTTAMIPIIDPSMIGSPFAPGFPTLTGQDVVEPTMLMPSPPPLPLPLTPPMPPPTSTQLQPQPVIKTKKLRIGDRDAVYEFYSKRFALLEQRGCIFLTRILIKIICPKKRDRYPYNGPSPPWWPKPCRSKGIESICHKDPSFIPKKPRIYLLIHLLRLIAEPHARQHPHIQKVKLTMATLEEKAMLQFWSFFHEASQSVRKRPIVDEIFHVAKAEESLKAGKIDSHTIINIWPSKTLRPRYRKRSIVYKPTANDFDIELPPNMTNLAPDPQFAGSVVPSGYVPEVPLEVPAGPAPESGHGVPAPATSSSVVTLPAISLPMEMIQLPAREGEYFIDNGQEPRQEPVEPVLNVVDVAAPLLGDPYMLLLGDPHVPVLGDLYVPLLGDPYVPMVYGEQQLEYMAPDAFPQLMAFDVGQNVQLPFDAGQFDAGQNVQLPFDAEQNVQLPFFFEGVIA
ncbi:hypothetical protein B0T21DRAFT_377438 [Apiosordaria backusii]|uniref:Subtelomeric hrmA-associated cluster protein AFUB-079030/YDR124W-like helical bundle domain-containing protein n=1 Tax=Apiosordaria backusii TaxID=314023 RepID=A0AA40DNE3_9PEZI|nr:hypothetical protein B0T21DRAFT_377438 [Apiosordaria backusii]